MCSYCPFGTYSERSGQSYCSACYLHSTSISQGSNSPSLCVCSAQYYGAPPNRTCTICPVQVGLSCPVNSTIPFVSAGYYRAGVIGSGGEADVSQCIPPSACMETNYSETTPCATGYTGVRCGTCDTSYYSSDSTCKSCPADIAKFGTISAAAVGLLLILYRVSSSGSQLPPDIRITLQAVQMIALYPNVSTKWPEPIVRMFNLLSITVLFLLSLLFSFNYFRISILSCFLQNAPSKPHSYKNISSKCYSLRLLLFYSFSPYFFSKYFLRNPEE